ncbi:hypothetical protein PPYR_11059 [Photinus pyralis]|uniref:Transmembrane protein n=1 Tax=Photinus pyralis TaxID=7054 RepID=A0A1Y1MTU1_PHOPY|nr:uncharacterized protein LOC116173155 isoform X2 [Photinus pyralis]KAB0796998.1 hypothetical protein PPYR_11059 [Photinus pyralis]
MCPGCGRVITIVQVLWSLIYVTCGAVQLVAGIFFIISIPEFYLHSNIWTGAWNVIIGIASGMTACFGQLSARRQEFLLYMAVSILAVNAVNVVLIEWCLYWTDLLSKLIANRPYQTLIYCACFATRIAGAMVIIVSFIDSQLAFCTMETAKKQTASKLRRSHEQVTDIEYIIPRQKSSKPYSAYNAYAQSWVFDADTGSCSNHSANSPYIKLSQNGTPKNPSLQHNVETTPKPTKVTHVIGNPVVQIEEASDDSTSNSDRKLNYMKSFSPCASPVVLSACSSQLSLNTNSVSNPPIYECLEKLTEASVYRSRLNSALSNKEEENQYQFPQQVMLRRVEAITPQGEKVQYASLMKELQSAIGNKKESETVSPQSSTKTNSKSSSRQDSSRTDGKNSDAEFSKELEAALQLIQDLESPNTIETPSETKSSLDGKEPRPLAVWRNSDASDSEKTLSAVGSLAELTSPISECHPELCTFKPSPHDVESVSKSVDDINDEDHKLVRRSSSGAANVWNVMSILRKKKQGLPKLCPELEGAIVKSESLAYLSELELLARHQRNKDIQRQIEQKVLQQLGSPRTESNC